MTAPTLVAFWVTELVARDRTADRLAYGLTPEDARASFSREHPEAAILHVRPVNRQAPPACPVPEPAAPAT